VPGLAARLIDDTIAAATSAGGGRARVIAVGWATVDLDRTIRGLATDLGVSAAAFVAAEGSQAIGGAGRVARAVLAGGRSLAILEPLTEGVLAGTLARWDEGPRIVWIETEDEDEGATHAGPTVPGPFGPERLVAGQAADGLLRLAVPPPGTIRA
jgi:hypothetical protein